MRAFVVRGPRQAGIENVPEPVPGPGEVQIQVRRAGVCGTDAELYRGDMLYLRDGSTSYPLRIGHEWAGVVTSAAADVDPSWIGRRVTGDTMIGCGVCRRCRLGHHNVCESLIELGIRGGTPGALAECMVYPARFLHPLPDEVDDTAAALVEPAGNALRAVWAAELNADSRVLILGSGTIGLLAAMFGSVAAAEVHIMGRSKRSLEFARSLGFAGVSTEETVPHLPWDAVIDCSNAPNLPAKALELVEPAGRVVYVGLAGSASMIDTRSLALKDVTAVGVLGASQALDGVIAAFANGEVDPRPLVAATVDLDGVAAVLGGVRPPRAGSGPKIHVAIESGAPCSRERNDP